MSMTIERAKEVAKARDYYGEDLHGLLKLVLQQLEASQRQFEECKTALCREQEKIKLDNEEQVRKNTEYLISELNKSQRQNSAMRVALEWASNKCDWCNGTGQDNDGEAFINEACPKCKPLRLALSPDAGKDFVPKSEVEALYRAIDPDLTPGKVVADEVVSRVEALRKENAELSALVKKWDESRLTKEALAQHDAELLKPTVELLERYKQYCLEWRHELKKEFEAELARLRAITEGKK